MRIGCTCKLSSVYTDSAQTLHKVEDRRPSCALTQPQIAAVDISHVAVISIMSTGSFVRLCFHRDVGVNDHSPPFNMLHSAH